MYSAMNEIDEKKLVLLEYLVKQYDIVDKSRSAFEKAYTQTNFYFGLIIATFGVSIWKLEELVLLVPLMILVQLSIVQWNQYYDFLGEVFLVELEKKINDVSYEIFSEKNCFSYYAFRDSLFHQNWRVCDSNKNST